MRTNLAAKLLGQHLGAKADAEERLARRQRQGDPVDFAGDPVVGIIGAHRSAEKDGPGVIVHAGGQGLAKAGAADVELQAARRQHQADAARRRCLGMQNDEDFPAHGSPHAFARTGLMA